MDMDCIGNLGFLDPELLQLNEVSPLAIKSNPYVVEKLFDQWLLLPETTLLPVPHSHSITPPYLNTSEGSPLRRLSASSQDDLYQQNQWISERRFRMHDTAAKNQSPTPLDNFVSNYWLKRSHLGNDLGTGSCKWQRRAKNDEQDAVAIAIDSAVEGNNGNDDMAFKMKLAS
ncbi:EF-hand domain pair [Artemisia annua]|uniref:EF-hand domain pair n=1 Tax=Artemisia annua TaxID=35608 RepID=A0A2U1N6T8_ARTAN|nr:EF-hand domain pair [Artemisia annua]